MKKRIDKFVSFLMTSVLFFTTTHLFAVRIAHIRSKNSQLVVKIQRSDSEGTVATLGPFSQGTYVEYAVIPPGNIKLSVFDGAGKQIFQEDVNDLVHSDMLVVGDEPVLRRLRKAT